jgi:hypothetical protein
MNSKQIKNILKLADKYYQYSSYAYKSASIMKALQFGSKGAMIISPLIELAMGIVKDNSEILKVSNSLYESLNTYKSSYGFGKHEDFLSNYMTKLGDFKSSFAEANNIKENDPENSLAVLKKIIDNGEFLVLNTKKVIDSIRSMKSVGGQAFDLLKELSLSFGAETATTNIIEQAGNLSMLLDAEFPNIEAKYQELMNAIETHSASEAGGNANGPAAEPTTETATPEESILSQLEGISL